MLNKKILTITLAVLMVVLMGFTAVNACTSIMVGKDASTDGSVMTTHTCDGNYDARIQIIEGEKFDNDAMTTVYSSRCHDRIPGYTVTELGEIPQAEETYTYFHVAYPFMNEHGVMIGEATFSGRGELKNTDAILMIEELERLALQRAKTAREAVQIMGELAEEYGYADGGESLTVIDGEEAWMFEIVGPGPIWSPGSEEPGAIWAAKRVPDGHVSVVSNRSRIDTLDLDDPDNAMASENVKSFAENMGWWDASEEFMFCETYNPNPYGAEYYQKRREWRVLSILAPSQNFDPQADRYPFSVKPDEKVSAQDLMAIKRDHYEGTRFDLTEGLAAGPFGNPNRYPTPTSVKPEGKKDMDWERAISMFRCSYSFVGQARSSMPAPIKSILWFGEDAPHSTVYVPVYSGTRELPESFTSGRRDKFDRSSAWWAFDFVSNWADLKYSYMIEDIQAMQEKYEGKFFDMQPAIDKAALEIYDSHGAERTKEFLTDYSYNNAQKVVDDWWEFADEMIYKYNDGYINSPDKIESVGYPTEWLEEVGFGEGTVAE